jgi:signal transduction histidine kinase
MVHNDLGRFEEELAALRRITLLVARGATPAEVFNAVAAETARVVGAEFTVMIRYRSDNTMVIVATWRPTDEATPPTGSVWSLTPDSVSSQIARTGRPARTCYDDATEGIGMWSKTHGYRWSVGCPIMVEGRLWGVMVLVSRVPLPEDDAIENRMLRFLELAGAAIANAEGRDELAASRARLVAAADATGRRIERDLHDGVQQRLIACGLQLREAQEHLPPGAENLDGRLGAIAECIGEVLNEVREISHGLHPAIVSRGGIGHAVKALARRSSVPVELHVEPNLRLPEAIEVAIYYLVSEALTNTTKHAHASVVHIDLTVHEALARVSVRDDGIGGADFDGGSGLIGLKDRTEALGGRLEIVSPAGAGTMVCAEIPLDGPYPHVHIPG